MSVKHGCPPGNVISVKNRRLLASASLKKITPVGRGREGATIDDLPTRKQQHAADISGRQHHGAALETFKPLV
jgi:hypothetical protein